MQPTVTVHLDFSRLLQNLEQIRSRTTAEIWAVIKADAYGLGAAKVASLLAPGVYGLCVFSLNEAQSIDLWNLTRRPIIALGPPATLDPRPWIAAHVRPAVSTLEQAAALRSARPILCVDTGMQRFSCSPEHLAPVIAAGGIDEAFTHATRIEQVHILKEVTKSHQLRLHACATSLLDHPASHLDAVRPGLAIYRGVARVEAPLVEVRQSSGPIGYSQWVSPEGYHGVILAGYAQGLRPGPVRVNGRPQRITEVGMQSAFVTLNPADHLGDLVVLLGEGVSEADVALAWNCTPHEVLGTLVRMSRT